MKKTLIGSLVICLYLVLTSFVAKDNYTIKVKIIGSDISEVSVLIDTVFKDVKVINGSFTLEGNTNIAKEAVLMYGKGTYSFYFESGITSVIINTDDESKNTVVGSSENELRKEFLTAVKKTNSKESLKSFIVDFANKHPNSPICLDQLFNSYAGIFSAVELRNIFSKFSKDIQASKSAVLLSKYIKLQEALVIGAPFINLSLPNTKGEIINLSDVVKNNKLIIIDFWASWCAPCREEIKSLKLLYNDYKSKGLEVYACSIDSKKNRWIKAIDEDKSNWIHVNVDSDSLKNKYDLRSIPRLYVIAKDGKFVANNLRGEGLAKFVKNYLDKN